MNVHLDALKVFCDVVRQRSFSRSAAMNHISQSAVSQTVSQLERHLGVQLIDRSKRPLALTSEGRVYFDGCRDLLDRYSAIEDQTRTAGVKTATTVHVASIYSVGLYDMNRHVRAFQQQFPHSRVDLDYVHPDQVYQRILDDDADLGVISFARTRRELKSIPWRTEPMVLVCFPGHPLTQSESADLGDLDGLAMVTFDEGLAIRTYIDRYLRGNGITMRVALEFDNIEAIKRGVESESGVAILPEPTVRREVHSGQLVSVAVRGMELQRPLSLIHRRRKVITPAMEAFVDILKASNEHTAMEMNTGDGRTTKAVLA